MKILIDTFIHQYLIHKNRKGGGKYDKTKSMSFNYNDTIYKIKVKIEYDNNDEHIENLYILNDNDEYDRCVIIIIYRDDETAIIQDLKSNSECIHSDIDISGNGIGTILMEFTINLLSKLKDNLNIKNIILTDNSVIPCKIDKIYPNINFADLYTLINSTPWYVKFGFKIYHKNTIKMNEITNIFNNNKNIMNNHKYNIDEFKNYIKESIYNANNADKQYLKNNLNKLLNILSEFNNNILLKNVLKEVSKKDCNLIRIMMNTIMKNLNIQSLSRNDYIYYL